MMSSPRRAGNSYPGDNIRPVDNSFRNGGVALSHRRTRKVRRYVVGIEAGGMRPAGDDPVAIGCLARELSFGNNIKIEYGDAERTLLGLTRHPDHWVRSRAYSSLMTLCSRTPRFDNPGLAYKVIVESLYDGNCQILRFSDGAAGYVAYFQGWKFPDRPRRRS
jgi:hypothetical protein